MTRYVHRETQYRQRDVGLVYFALAGTTPPEKYTIRAFPTPRERTAALAILLLSVASFKILHQVARTGIFLREKV